MSEMWFPTGLSARLWGHRISHAFSSKPAPAIFHLSPFVRHFPPSSRFEDAIPETEWHTPETCVQAAKQAGAPAVWLGGVEPLLHPAIGKVATALEESERYVFLHTSAVDLRKRIHEFRPTPQFFFAFKLGGEDAAQGQRIGQGASQKVIDALRVIKLSGFFACVHVSVGEQTRTSDIARLFDSLEASRVDGIAVSSGGASPDAARDTMLGKKLAEIRDLIPLSRWREFSQLLEASYLQTSAVKEQPNMQARGADACEESA